MSKPTGLALRSLSDIVTSHGYPFETHSVITQDGYILTLFRIPHERKQQEKQQRRPHSQGGDHKRPVALLWHGLLDSAFTWITNGPTKSLAFLLADRGYDVWLANNRGTCYSRNHVYLNSEYDEYWRFTWDEFVKYDLPDTLEYITEKTGRRTVSYVGHSEGTTQLFAALAETPELRNKLNCFVGLGPVASVSKCSNFFLVTIAKFHVDSMLLKLFKLKKSFMSPLNTINGKKLFGLLVKLPGAVDDILCLVCGKPDKPFDKKTISEWAEHEPGGTSVLNICHWCQAIRSETPEASFSKFDYGTDENFIRYNQLTPPRYDLSKIPDDLPISLYWGTADCLADPTDVQYILDTLPSKVKLSNKVSGYNHTDYMWDDSADKDIYLSLLTFLDQYNAIKEK